MRRSLVLFAVIATLVGAACVPLATPADTTHIESMGTSTVDGWRYDAYRDLGYPCSISGYQTFVIGTKVGQPAAESHPLFVYMHGGGVGYFDDNGNPIPGPGQKVEESGASLTNRLTNNGLLGRIRSDAAGFRTLAVSYCSHDLYGGSVTPDPHNPNLTPEGGPRPTTGLASVKAAVQYATAQYPTTKTFLYGGSAGSAGTFGVAWAMQQQGIAPAGLIADASVVNVEAFAVGNADGICTDKNSGTRVEGVSGRIHPDLADPANEADKLVSTGRLTVPIMHIWNHADMNTCGAPPVACPMRDGSTVTMGYTDCIHEPMRQAIAAEGPTSRSRNLPVCVTPAGGDPCSTHVVTTKPNAVNTDPQTPADFLSVIVDWIHARLADT
jgi:acetyl esterase/lipase